MLLRGTSSNQVTGRRCFSLCLKWLTDASLRWPVTVAVVAVVKFIVNRSMLLNADQQASVHLTVDNCYADVGSSDVVQVTILHLKISALQYFEKWWFALGAVVKFSRSGFDLQPVSGIPSPEIAVPPLKLSFHHLATPFRHHNKCTEFYFGWDCAQDPSGEFIMLPQNP